MGPAEGFFFLIFFFFIITIIFWSCGWLRAVTPKSGWAGRFSLCSSPPLGSRPTAETHHGSSSWRGDCTTPWEMLSLLPSQMHLLQNKYHYGVSLRSLREEKTLQEKFSEPIFEVTLFSSLLWWWLNFTFSNKYNFVVYIHISVCISMHIHVSKRKRRGWLLTFQWA